METVESDFHAIIDGALQDFVTASNAFEVKEISTLAAMVTRAFNAEFSFIRKGLNLVRPDNDDNLRRAFEPINAELRQIQEFRDRNRHLDMIANHLATVAESIGVLSWVIAPRNPVQIIRDMKEAGDYFGNRVLVENRGNKTHMNWINKWNSLLTSLEEYVRRHHLTGFAWNSLKKDPSANRRDFNFPPPPPPPPVEALIPQDDSEAMRLQAERAADREQLMIQLAQGEGIQRILKPVNRKAGVPAEGGTVKNVGSQQNPALKSKQLVTHPPVFVLEGRKWRVEYQNENSLPLTPSNKSESLAMYQCKQTNLQTEAKMNAVSIDSCTRCNVLLQDIIASVEMIRCKNMEVHCLGSCPTVTLDKCDSVQVFLGDKSASCEVITSACTSINICRLTADGDYVEYAVPEQIRSVLGDNHLQTTVVEHHM